MKSIIIALLVSFFSLITTYGQLNLKHVFPGNWQFCESDFGYSEIHVKDSVFEYNSEFNPSGMSFRYKIIDNLVLYGYEKWTDTFKIEVINIDSIHLYHYKTKKDSYYRKMDEAFTTGFDYDCKLKVNFYEFNDLLEEEFNFRKYKYYDNCYFNEESELEKDSVKVEWLEIPDTFDEDLLKTYEQRGYLYAGMSYNKLNEVESSSADKLIEFNYKNDTLNIILETTDSCYYTYTDFVTHTNESTLNLVFKPLSGRCNEICKFQLNYRIAIDLDRYKTFLFNGKKLK